MTNTCEIYIALIFCILSWNRMPKFNVTDVQEVAENYSFLAKEGNEWDLLDINHQILQLRKIRTIKWCILYVSIWKNEVENSRFKDVATLLC